MITIRNEIDEFAKRKIHLRELRDKGLQELKDMNICKKCIYKDSESCNLCMIYDKDRFCLYKEGKNE